MWIILEDFLTVIYPNFSCEYVWENWKCEIFIENSEWHEVFVYWKWKLNEYKNYSYFFFKLGGPLLDPISIKLQTKVKN